MGAPGTDSKNWRKAYASDSTSGSFTAKAPSATEPTGAGVFTVAIESLNYSPSNLIILPFGTDANDEAFNMRLWGWNWSPEEAYWIPTKLLEIAVTLGSQAAGFQADTFLADTIAVTHGNATVLSPADNTTAYVYLKLFGAQLIEFDVDLNGAAAANAFFRSFSPVQ